MSTRRYAEHVIDQVLTPAFVRETALQLDQEQLQERIPPPGRRPRRTAPFIPSDRLQSQLQSALEERVAATDTLTTRALATASPCGTEPPPPDASPRAAQETLTGEFGPDDIRWVQTKIAEIQRAGWAPFSTAPVDFPLHPQARVLLVSDWATGLAGAQAVGELMRERVKEAVAAGREVHVIHLGDVYYCGRPAEYASRFFRYWPVKVGDGFEHVHSWNLNGNHDMYAGGFGYFGVIAGDTTVDPGAALFAQQGGCSYFKLHNEHWRIYGLDTAYDKDQHLGAAQLEWIRGELRTGGGQAMLLSHHQLDSVYDRARVNGVLLDELGDNLRAGRVRAWFWGHEHRCVRYEPYAGVQYPRCIGNGGVPEVVETTLFGFFKKVASWAGGLFKHRRAGRPPKILSESTGTWAAEGVHWRRHGFVCLDLDGPEVTASYVDQCGKPVWPAETLR
jgi:hypothetical protein